MEGSNNREVVCLCVERLVLTRSTADGMHCICMHRHLLQHYAVLVYPCAKLRACAESATGRAGCTAVPLPSAHLAGISCPPCTWGCRAQHRRRHASRPHTCVLLCLRCCSRRQRLVDKCQLAAGLAAWPGKLVPFEPACCVLWVLDSLTLPSLPRLCPCLTLSSSHKITQRFQSFLMIKVLWLFLCSSSVIRLKFEASCVVCGMT